MINRTQLIGNVAFSSGAVEIVRIKAHAAVQAELAAVLAPAKTRDDVQLLAMQYVANHRIAPEEETALHELANGTHRIDSEMLTTRVGIDDDGDVADITFTFSLEIRDTDFCFSVNVYLIGLVS